MPIDALALAPVNDLRAPRVPLVPAGRTGGFAAMLAEQAGAGSARVAHPADAVIGGPVATDSAPAGTDDTARAQDEAVGDDGAPAARAGGDDLDRQDGLPWPVDLPPGAEPGWRPLAEGGAGGILGAASLADAAGAPPGPAPGPATGSATGPQHAAVSGAVPGPVPAGPDRVPAGESPGRLDGGGDGRVGGGLATAAPVTAPPVAPPVPASGVIASAILARAERAAPAAEGRTGATGAAPVAVPDGMPVPARGLAAPPVPVAPAVPPAGTGAAVSVHQADAREDRAPDPSAGASRIATRVVSSVPVPVPGPAVASEAGPAPAVPVRAEPVPAEVAGAPPVDPAGAVVGSVPDAGVAMPAAPGPEVAGRIVTQILARLAEGLPLPPAVPPVAAGGPAAGSALVLSPPELGRLVIRFEGDPSSGTLILQVERPETLELMRRHLDLLDGAIRAAGHDRCQILLSDHGQPGAGQPQSGSGQKGGAAPAGAPPEPEPGPGAEPAAELPLAETLRRATADRLDLRL